MSGRIDFVASQMALLQRVRQEFRETQPFAGKTIGTGIHLEAKTVSLILTLREGGAALVCTGNLNSTQPDAVEYLRERGVEVIATQTQDSREHQQNLQAVLDRRPDIILDNGGDLFAGYLDMPYEGLLGGTEETTSGRMRLEPLRNQLSMPILVINDSPIKQFVENEHAVGQSVLESYMRITNKATNGKRVTVVGYGFCGQGVATNFRNAHAFVSVIEVDPVKRLRAHFDGFDTPPRQGALSTADVIVTVTGARGVITAEDLSMLKDGAILANAGHFPFEIDVEGILTSSSVRNVVPYGDAIEKYELSDGRHIFVLANGHMVNLAGPRPMGNSIESMDIGFALQARCLEAVASGRASADQCVVPVPRQIDEWVATAYLDTQYAGKST